MSYLFATEYIAFLYISVVKLTLCGGVVTVLALTCGCRYDVGAKEFKPVAAKEVCAFFLASIC